MLTNYRAHKMITPEAAELLRDGRRKHRFYKLMREKGVVEEPILKSKIKYAEYAPNSTTIPTEAERLLNEVLAIHPVKQVVVGHEIVEKPKEKEQRIEQKTLNLPLIGEVSLVIAVILAVYVIPITLLAWFFTFDPQLIVVLDDGRETWVEIARWDDFSG